jgi:hypothetical protein
MLLGSVSSRARAVAVRHPETHTQLLLDCGFAHRTDGSSSRQRQRWPPRSRAGGSQNNSCIPRKNYYFRACPISHVPVVACRSVGIRTRGRTAAWGSESLLKKSDRQPEAKPVNSVLSGGRDLKQRRTGFLVSAGLPTAGPETEEACFSLPAVRCGVFPNPSQGSFRGSRTLAVRRVSTARRGEAENPQFLGRSVAHELYGGERR